MAMPSILTTSSFIQSGGSFFVQSGIDGFPFSGISDLSFPLGVPKTVGGSAPPPRSALRGSSRTPQVRPAGTGLVPGIGQGDEVDVLGDDAVLLRGELALSGVTLLDQRLHHCGDVVIGMATVPITVEGHHPP